MAISGGIQVLGELRTSISSKAGLDIIRIQDMKLGQLGDKDGNIKDFDGIKVNGLKGGEAPALTSVNSYASYSI